MVIRLWVSIKTTYLTKKKSLTLKIFSIYYYAKKTLIGSALNLIHMR